MFFDDYEENKTDVNKLTNPKKKQLCRQITLENLHEVLQRKFSSLVEEKEKEMKRANDPLSSNESEHTKAESNAERVNNASMDLSEDSSLTGRLGPKIVTIEKRYCYGQYLVNKELLELSSLSNFSSFRANVCLFAGKWMYEVTLLTDGLQQIGWAPLNWAFTDEMGVGDFLDSYAYDGKRKRKWSIKEEVFGPDWSRGDVIGAAIDLEEGTVSFYRNGIPLGVAFQQIRTKIPGLAYFPALSISHGESVLVNFGNRPLEYPVEGYQPVQQSEQIFAGQKAQFKYGMECVETMLPLLATASIPTEQSVLALANLFDHIGPLVESPYLVISHFVPLVEKLCLKKKKDQLEVLSKYLEISLEAKNPSIIFLILFNLLKKTFKDFEIEELFSHFWFHVSLKCSMEPVQKGEDYQGHWLSIALYLLSIPSYMEQFVSLKAFSDFLEKLYVVKSPNIDTDLAQWIPNVYWDDTNTFCEETDKQIQENSRSVILKNLERREQALLNLTLLFFSNNNPFSRQISGLEKNSTPRRVYLQWARSLVSKNKTILEDVSLYPKTIIVLI